MLQGERPMAADNKSLGKFNLDGIPSAPRGIPQIEVTFDIDANGILNVTALDKATNRSQHITITASSGLCESEIQKMKQEAEAHADEDKKRKELVEVKNNADNSIYTAEKLMRENGDKIPAEIKKEVEDSAAKVKEVLNSDNAMPSARPPKTCSRSSRRLAPACTSNLELRKKPQPVEKPPVRLTVEMPSGGTPPGENPGDVVDGEFKNV